MVDEREVTSKSNFITWVKITWTNYDGFCFSSSLKWSIYTIYLLWMEKQECWCELCEYFSMKWADNNNIV